ncbi:uncharacterized protein [Ptychodera flava]
MGRLFIMDSMYDRITYSTDIAVKGVRSYLEAVAGAEGSDRLSIKEVKLAKVAKQTGRNDCGPVMLHNISEVFAKVESLGLQGFMKNLTIGRDCDAARVRRSLLASIYTYRL